MAMHWCINFTYAISIVIWIFLITKCIENWMQMFHYKNGSDTPNYAQSCHEDFTSLKNTPAPRLWKSISPQNCKGTTPPTRESEDKAFKEIDLDCKTIVHKTWCSKGQINIFQCDSMSSSGDLLLNEMRNSFMFHSL